MHVQDICTIGKTDDDKYVVCVQVERKQKDKNGKETKMPYMVGDEGRTFVCDDEKDVAEALSKLLPTMKKGRLAEDDYAAAFKEGEKEEE